MNIYEQISSNKRKTFLIMAVFVAVISAFGYVIGEIYGGSGAGVPFMIMAVFFSGITSVSSYFFSDKVVLSIAGAKKVGREQTPQIYGILENLCIGAGLKKIPDLYLIRDTAPNAFATGRDPDHAVVAVTSGLIDKLDKREIEAVLAHELSHVRNYDIRLMMIVAVLVGTITMIANFFLRGGLGSSNRKSGAGIFLLIGIVLALFSPLIAELIKLAISRNREYLADASAALLTRDPEGLASALVKISADKEPLEVANEATAHIYISNPLKRGKNADFFANLFNTHPPVEDRVNRLRSM
jgi:heat shock protein HtpX